MYCQVKGILKIVRTLNQGVKYLLKTHLYKLNKVLLIIINRDKIIREWKPKFMTDHLFIMILILTI